MPALHTYDYAIVRVVPRVDRGEFVNAGIILSCDVAGFLRADIHFNEALVLALEPRADVDLVRRTLAAIPVICRGGTEAGDLGRLSARERFHWLVAPRSTMVQTSPVHTGRCPDLNLAVAHLMTSLIHRDL